jgi:uncharacterized protein YqjF (DUF2071 family)
MDALLEVDRVKPMFLANWVDVVFMHFEVDAARLGREVPVELDLWEGKALVTLVAFTQQRLRPRWGGRLSEWMSGPVGEHEFLNVRTYVRVGGERGIYFLAEWIPNALARVIGPRLYGLPYRLGRLRYCVDEEGGCVTGDVRGAGRGVGRFVFAARVDADQVVSEAQMGTRDEFLLERYAAFTYRHGVLRRFRIAHERWPWVRAKCVIEENSLLAGMRWTEGARMVAAHYSAGVRDVRIGMPRKMSMKQLEMS